ncbi:MAG TPA: PaaI family thioesterase [Caulobacteraceae bacterium]|jgi:uncharacterized protein (TIGR00369 family)
MTTQQTLTREPGSFMRELFRMTPFNTHLGLELGDVSPERLVVRFTKRTELTLPGGTLHGGALAAAIDVAGAYHAGVAIHQRMSREGGDTDRSHGVRTISLNVDYLKALTADAYTATTTVLHTGASIVRVRAECVDDRGDLVATASLNFSY